MTTLVPLDRIPETLPAPFEAVALAPLDLDEPDACPAGTRVIVLSVHGDGAVSIYCHLVGAEWTVDAGPLALDLSAPPLDASGNPTRMDALQWAAMVLACRLTEGWEGNPMCDWAVTEETTGPYDDPQFARIRIWCGFDEVLVVALAGDVEPPGEIPSSVARIELDGHEYENRREALAAALNQRVGLEAP